MHTAEYWTAELVQISSLLSAAYTAGYRGTVANIRFFIRFHVFIVSKNKEIFCAK
jgi:hypothetical protein